MHEGSNRKVEMLSSEVSSDQAPPQSAVAARLRLKNELSDAISTIVDRDLFLQRLARRVAELSGNPWVAIYTRGAGGGDLLLRSSTLPRSERIPARVAARTRSSSVPAPEVATTAGTTNRAVSIPIGGHGDLQLGALEVYASPGRALGERERDVLASLASEMAPAIFVAEQHHAVKQASVVDLATGAYASWYVTQRLDEEIARSLRSGQPVAVVLVGVLDYDDLQRTIGFARRDELLRELATEYAGLTRVFDIVGTRSPSEFIFVLPETGIASAATVIERVQQRTERVATRLGYGDLARSLRVVAGAAATPGDGDRAVAVLLAAEHRLNQNELQYRHSMERS